MLTGKIKNFIFVAVVAIALFSKMTYAAEQGYWKFNEASGTTAIDLSGNGNNGTIYGAQWSESVQGTVLAFDGSNDYVNIPAAGSLDSQSFTVEIWLNPTYKETDHDGFFYSSPALLRFYLDSSSHKAWVRWKKTDGSYITYNLTAQAVPENEWTHLVFSYDSTADVLTGYKNGKLEVTNTNVGGIYDKFGGNIRIGWANNIGNYFLGEIDDVKVYNYVLSTGEVYADYANKSLLGCWNFSEGTGTSAADLSGNGNDGTVDGAAWTMVSGMALSFDGTDDYVNIPDDNSLQTQSFSLEMWFRTKGNFAGENHFFYSTSSNLRFFVDSGTHAIKVRWRKTDGTYLYYTLVNSSNEDEWIFFNATYDSAADTLKGYKNGELDCTVSNVGGLYAGFGGLLNIGRNPLDSLYFNGLIDDIRVCDRVITDEEAYNHYSTPGVIAALEFDEGSGATAEDSSGNGNDGTISGATWTEGALGRALSFDGANDYVNIPAAGSLETQSFSVEMWLNPTYSETNHDGFFYSSPALLRFYLDVTLHKAWVRWRKADGSYMTYGLTTQAVPENEWSHLVFSYDSEADVLTGFMNGQLEVTNNNVGGLYDKFGGYIRIGYAYNIGNYFLGEIDGAKIYDEPLNTDKVNDSYTSKGLKAHWDFDDGTGNILTDVSSNENNGTVFGAQWESDASGYALNFDGVDDYVDIASNLDSQSFSLEMWLKTKGNFTGENHFFCSSPANLRFYVNNGAHPVVIRWRQANGDYRSYTVISSTNEDRWVFVSIVYNNETDTLTGYKNGVLDSTITNVGGIYDKFGGNLKIGYNSTSNKYFNGLIDELRIYDRVLRSEEVSSHYEAVPLAEEPALALTYGIDTRDAKDVTMTVNGQTVQGANGQWSFNLREGLNVITVNAVADGANPALRFNISGQDELETRWRIGTNADSSWVTDSFDDTSWTIAQADGQGYLSFSSTGYFRQIVLWGEHYYDGLPALQPKVQEWGFSQNSMETFFHPLYSPPPLTFDMSNYEFILDVPTDFSLLQQDFTAETGGGRLNRAPSNITSETVQHDSQNYTRYHFAYASTNVRPYSSTGYINMALIPLLLGNTSLTTCNFYFHRLASGNVTEIEQQLPVRVLPAINGSMPTNVAIQQYRSTPWRDTNQLYPEHFESHIVQSLAAGFNKWVISPMSGTYGRAVHDRVLTGNASVILWGQGNYPLYGNLFDADCALGQLMLAESDSYARFFNDLCTWQENIGGVGWRFCPSFAAGSGASLFKQAVKSDIEDMLDNFPGATTYWVDWEQLPWRADYGGGSVYTDETAPSYCFCSNCKAAFYTYAGIQGPLTDDQIKSNYKTEWSLFREELDGQINGILDEACSELNVQYLIYDQLSHEDFWEACSGEISAAFVGVPAGDVCYSDQQELLDDTMAFFRNTVGLDRLIGQQFAASYDVNYPWENWVSRQDRDGFWKPKMLKLQILRIVASVHGGIDLNSSMECFAGMKYYIGEATRIISTYEDLFWDGERDDSLASSNDIAYPNLLVLKDGTERLVLLFNEGTSDLSVTLNNLNLNQGQQALVFGTSTWVSAAQMSVTVPAEDVLVIYIQ